MEIGNFQLGCERVNPESMHKMKNRILEANLTDFSKSKYFFKIIQCQ
jgi:hypothetical protein